MSEWSCLSTADGVPNHGRAVARSTQLGVLAHQAYAVGALLTALPSSSSRPGGGGCEAEADRGQGVLPRRTRPDC